MKITVFLVDDHAVVRDGLRLLLESQPDIHVVGDSGNARAAVRQIADLCPDVVIVDIAMPDLNGIEVMRQVREVCRTSRFVVLSMYSTSEHIYRALQAGADGYVLKESAGNEVVSAVRAVYAGQRFLSQKITDQVIDGFMSQNPLAGEDSPLTRLSSRELEILQLVVEGYSSVEIGDRLALSRKTVETYRSRMMEKLGINDLPGLVKFAIQHGLTSLE